MCLSQRKVFMFRRFAKYIKNKGLCFSMESRSKKVVVSICSDLNAARIETPYTNILADGMDEIVPALTEAYKAAQDAKDEVAMEEIHNVRQTISKVYA
ncbi:MAG: hypothetical protein NTW48_08395, partial [Chloroflexi bacterium]|nr:hypothetical protein [Chloroflexota bacterium]